jgi:predicted ester cyclase
MAALLPVTEAVAPKRVHVAANKHNIINNKIRPAHDGFYCLNIKRLARPLFHEISNLKAKTDMKKILFTASIVLCCFLIACNNDGGSSGSNNDNNISAARDIFKGIETGDTTKFASIAPDAVDHAGPFGEVSGADSIKAYLAGMRNHIKDLKIEILGEAANGDHVYTWNKWSGTALDSTMGFPANQPFTVSGVDIVRFKDGKIVEHWGTVDQKDLMTMRALQMPNATTVKVTMGDTSRNSMDTTRR